MILRATSGETMTQNQFVVGMIFANILFSLLLFGCGGSETVPPVAVEAPSISTSATPAAPAPPPPPALDLSGAITASAPASVSNGETEPKEPMEREKAVVGAGKKGRNYGGGIISEPVRAYFRTGQRVVFEIQIPKALQLYEASNNGKGPESHEVFMKEIIEENLIELPELPDGETYFFDAEAQELMVQRSSD